MDGWFEGWMIEGWKDGWKKGWMDGLQNGRWVGGCSGCSLHLLPVVFWCLTAAEISWIVCWCGCWFEASVLQRHSCSLCRCCRHRRTPQSPPSLFTPPPPRSVGAQRLTLLTRGAASSNSKRHWWKLEPKMKMFVRWVKYQTLVIFLNA